MRSWIAALTLVWLAALATPASAQFSIELHPRYGAFIPTGDVYHPYGGLTYHQEPGAVAGVNLTTFISPRWGFEITALRSQSTLRSGVHPVGNQLDQANSLFPAHGDVNPGPVNPVVGGAWIWLFGANGILNLPVERSSATLHLIFGGGVVARGGTGYDRTPLGQSTSVSTTLGLGTRIHLWRGIALRADLEDHVSWPCFAPAAAGQADCPQSQNDFTMTTGLSVMLRGLQ